MEEVDLVVIGAGVSGLAIAKTFYQLNPDRNLLILEAASTLGGTWAKERLYPGLKSNNMLGTYEYPDFPMDPDTFGVKPGEHIPGAVLHDYVRAYAEKFGILQKIKCGHKVLIAEHLEVPEGGWVLTAQDPSGAKCTFAAKKLVVATGLTSQPFMPDFNGQESFEAPLFHNKDFLKHAGTIKTAKSVTVFGGTKSAWDAVYEYATNGVHVDWVIRASGHGPCWMAPPYVTPLKKWLEKLVHTRLLTWFSPCVWGSADGYPGVRNFLHGTFVGRFIVNTFWGILGNDVITLNKYDSHPEMQKLKPWSQAMFVGAGLSILNYSTDFFDLVRDGTVSVHIADIDRLSSHTVHLSDGKSFRTDAFMSTTGWKHVPPMKFLPAGIEKELGVPSLTPNHDNEDDAKLVWNSDAVRAADEEILARFPRLKDQPVQNKTFTPMADAPGMSTSDPVAAPSNSAPVTPYHLYRFMVPASDRLLRSRDLAFVGMTTNITFAPIAHLQSLWIYAYFQDKLPLNASLESQNQEAGTNKTTESVQYETVLHSRFGKWRYPAGHGAQFPDFVFDAVPYLDLLLGDLGVRSHRKSGWLAEITEPYGPQDYRDVVGEWAKMNDSS
ncbi:hypothetical protein PG984_015391 [Apiospora sp. TS-2023a]